MIYFDSAATSFLKPPEVEQAVLSAFHTMGNAGRGAHAPTLNASRMIYDSREKLAQLFHIKNPARIAFTHNATESLNMAICGFVKEGDHVITTCMEHNSVLRPIYKNSASFEILTCDGLGRVPLRTVEEIVKKYEKDYFDEEPFTDDDEKADRVKIVFVMTHASNLTGNVNDLSAISKKIKSIGGYLIVDASQTAGCLPIDVEEMGIDILCFTGHKGLLGPQGTGGIYVREGLSLTPLVVGGSGVHSFEQAHPSKMPTALEAGTLNAHGIAGLRAGLEFILETGVDRIHEKESKLARQFVAGLRDIAASQSDSSRLFVYGDVDAPIHAPIVSLNIKEMDSQLVSDILWEDYEICVRAGAHCAPLMHEHFGTRKQGAVRFSFSYFNTEEEVECALRAIADLM